VRVLVGCSWSIPVVHLSPRYTLVHCAHPWGGAAASEPALLSELIASRNQGSLI
jgi:hypothetical protein